MQLRYKNTKTRKFGIWSLRSMNSAFHQPYLKLLDINITARKFVKHRLRHLQSSEGQKTEGLYASGLEKSIVTKNKLTLSCVVRGDAKGENYSIHKSVKSTLEHSIVKMEPNFS